jgi:site-specific recombinase XerD
VPPPNHPDHRARVAAAVVDMEGKRSPHARYSLSWVIADWQATSPAWRSLGPKTRKDKAALLKRMEKPWGKYDMRTLDGPALTALMDTVKADATHNRMKTLWHQLFKHMQKRGWVSHDPTDAIERRKWKTSHTHIWTAAERKTYCDYWPIGTKQRAAYHLMFDTRQSCADAAYMGRRMVEDGFLTEERRKTGGRFTVRLTGDLERAVEPFSSLTTYLLTQSGKPYSERGLHNAMSKWIGEAGLPDRCTPHGLRGAGLTEDAEAGATEKELMNIGGFENSSEVKIYIREANRRTLATRTYERHKAANRGEHGGEPTHKGLK